jgi:pepF/M3 family oligoendopeptidase
MNDVAAVTRSPDDPITQADFLPRWDLDSVFPGPESEKYQTAFDAISRGTGELEALFDRHGVGAGESASDRAEASVVADIIGGYNTLLDRAAVLAGYLYCLTAADVRDETAQSAASEWRILEARLAALAPRFTSWIGTLDLEAATASDMVREHLPALRRMRAAAAYLMEPGQEALAAALGPTGGAAWLALRDELVGGAMATIELDGDVRELPLSEIDNLRFHADREVRRRAFEAETTTLRALNVPLAAAINGVKGEQLTLDRLRGWDDPLDQALFDAAIDRPILDALLGAIEEALPDYLRYLRAKARLLGLPVLAGYDLLAPVGVQMDWPFASAREFIIEQFVALGPALGDVAARAFAERWIDAETRPGKDSGAFCVPVGGDASRVFTNYLPVYDGMSTLAHELGHAYHTAVVARAGRTPLQAPPEEVTAPLTGPLTLGETASTFCEALAQRAARGLATPSQEAALLDGWLQAVSLNVFTTYSYFLFERELFVARRERELSPVELESLMAKARRDVSGDAVDPETVNATSWTIVHLFIDNLVFYNFPYAFGMLFSLGLLAAREANPEGFLERFDILLADYGIREANELAAAFGIDLADPAFWRASFDTFRADVDRFEALAAGVG